MEIKRLEDKNFKNLLEFCKIYMPNSFVYDENFLKYWFLDKHNNWLIDIVIRKNKIISANFKIENIALLNRKKCNFIWTSTALTSLQNKKDPNMGLILFNIHRSADVVGAISPNKNSIKLNSNLGIKIKNINLQRYIFLHDHNFIKILKVDKKKLFKNKKIISLKKNNKIKSSWVSVIPKDYNNLWKKFSNK